MSVVLASCGGQPVDNKPIENPPVVTPPVVKFDAVKANNLYMTSCSACHGADGAGLAALPGTELKGKVMYREELLHDVKRMPAGLPPACKGIEGCDEGMTDFLASKFITLRKPIPAAVSCETSGELLAPKIRRLTASQYQNTIKSIFGDIFAGVTWPDFGDDHGTIGFNNSGDRLNINAINYASVYKTVNAITVAAIQQQAQIKACAASTSTTCVSDLLNQFGSLIWRRPLTMSERTTILGLVTGVANAGGTKTQQTEVMLKALLLSPNFLYRQELGSLTGNVRALTSYEIASLLSYSLLDTSPDATLISLAANNELLKVPVIQQQVTRLIADPRFEDVVVKFYTDYLKLDTVLTINKNADVNFTQSLRQALLSGSEMAIRDLFTGPDVGIGALMKSESFFVNKESAPIYGLDPNNFGTTLVKAAPPAKQRYGLVTQPAFFAVHAKEGGSGMVKRAVFTLEQMLCQDLPAPPPGVKPDPVPAGIDPLLTSERKLHELTHASKSACSGCHSFIDPAGVGYENYDTLGRFRTVEKSVVTIDASGKLTLDSADLLFNNGVEYVHQLLETKEFKACLNQRFLEFMIGQEVEKFSCESSKLESQVQQNGESFKSMVNALVQLESFRLRGSK